MLASALGWLPRAHPAYRLMTDQLLPFSLSLLLLGLDVSDVLRAGRQALLAATIGATGIVFGTALGAWWLAPQLPPDAWKGAGALAGTWTGGTMNLLALRAILQTPETMFAPLVVVDAVIAYGWMALLVAASGSERTINRWLGAGESAGGTEAARDTARSLFAQRGTPEAASRRPRSVDADGVSGGWAALLAGGLLSVGLALGARSAAARLPTSILVSSAAGWTVLLVSSAAIGLSLMPRVRSISRRSQALGFPCLYVVLAATGAQSSLGALASAPVWVVLGAWTVAVHGALLLAAGRIFRIPLGILATASQANLGGVVSAPLVGAVYHESLVPVGLLLAMAANMLGTHLGLLSAALCRWLIGS
jgi:uncharacterized membrane protein